MTTKGQQFREAYKEYKQSLTKYTFEIDTEDVVFGFKKTLKKSTKDLTKAILLKSKLKKDVGEYISCSVKINEVRFYENGVLVKKLN